MPQYAVMIFERELPGGVADIPPEVHAAPRRAAGADRASRRARRRGAGAGADRHGDRDPRQGVLTDGPFIETKEALHGVFVIEARDLDHALALAR